MKRIFGSDYSLFFSVILFSIGFSLFIRAFVFDVFRVKSNSMAPSLLSGDIILSSKRFNFQRGDVVAFEFERGVTRGEKSKRFVKRIAATAGDTLRILHGKTFVNGLPQESGITPSVSNYGPISVPRGHVFVLGDNLNDSYDSRSFGPIPVTCLEGKISLIWASLDPVGHIRWDRLLRWIK